MFNLFQKFFVPAVNNIRLNLGDESVSEDQVCKQISLCFMDFLLDSILCLKFYYMHVSSI